MAKRSPLVRPEPLSGGPIRLDASKITVSSITADSLIVSPSSPVRLLMEADGSVKLVQDGIDNVILEPPEDNGDTEPPSRSKRIRNPFRKKKS